MVVPVCEHSQNETSTSTHIDDAHQACSIEAAQLKRQSSIFRRNRLPPPSFQLEGDDAIIPMFVPDDEHCDIYRPVSTVPVPRPNTIWTWLFAAALLLYIFMSVANLLVLLHFLGELQLWDRSLNINFGRLLYVLAGGEENPGPRNNTPRSSGRPTQEGRPIHALSEGSSTQNSGSCRRNRNRQNQRARRINDSTPCFDDPFGNHQVLLPNGAQVSDSILSRNHTGRFVVAGRKTRCSNIGGECQADGDGFCYICGHYQCVVDPLPLDTSGLSDITPHLEPHIKQHSQYVSATGGQNRRCDPSVQHHVQMPAGRTPLPARAKGMTGDHRRTDHARRTTPYECSHFTADHNTTIDYYVPETTPLVRLPSLPTESVSTPGPEYVHLQQVQCESGTSVHHGSEGDSGPPLVSDEPQSCTITLPERFHPKQRPMFTEHVPLFGFWSWLTGYKRDTFTYGEVGCNVRVMKLNKRGVSEFMGSMEIPISQRIDEDLYAYLYGHKKHQSEYSRNGTVDRAIMYIHLDQLALKHRALMNVKDEELDLAYWQRQDYTIGVCMQETTKAFLIDNNHIHNEKRSWRAYFVLACLFLGLLSLVGLALFTQLSTTPSANGVNHSSQVLTGNSPRLMTANHAQVAPVRVRSVILASLYPSQRDSGDL